MEAVLHPAKHGRGWSARTRRRAWLLAPVVLAASTVGITTPAAGDTQREATDTADTVVAAWDAVGVQASTAAGLSPGDGHTVFAYLGIAVYDSVIAVKGGYEPFAVHADSRSGASAEAAVAAAARRILNHYLPGQAATITDPAYVASLAAIPNGPAKDDGIATGETVAAELIALRADDGFRASVPPYVPPDPPVPGVWLPTAPTPAIGLYFPAMRPFSLQSADQFRPGGPPALWTKKWAREYNEVKSVGSNVSTTRTPEQTVAARFWAEPPVPQQHAALRKFVLDHRLGIVDAARFMAMVSVVFADGNIACFDAKYHYAFWRPITAIRAGDTDGNEATIGDPSWTPLLPATPNHPDYPSAHSCITPGAGRVIATFLGTRDIDFTVPSLTGLGDRRFDSVQALEFDVSEARVWGGIHFRSAIQDGVAIARKVTNWVLEHHFQRTTG
jgi:hypothetical protein